MNRTIKYEWVPEGDGYTLFRSTPISTVRYNCGRLNTNASGSTVKLAELYNAAPDLLAACKDELEALTTWRRLRRLKYIPLSERTSQQQNRVIQLFESIGKATQ